MTDEQNKGGHIFGSNWAQELGGKTAEKQHNQFSDNKKLDVGDFALFGDESIENTDNPLLKQEEIDSILPSDGARQKEEKGLGVLVNSQRITAERLPALEGIYERFARISAGSLRYFTSENVDVTFGKIAPVRFGDYLNSIPLPSLLVVFKAEEWESRGLIVLDNDLIYSVVDILHGGRRTKQLQSNEGKPYTIIETRMVERLVNAILNDLASAFDPVSTVNLQFERMENDPRFASIALPANTAVVANFNIGIDRRSGSMHIVMPYRTIEPVKAELSQQLLGESFGEYGAWAKHFSDSVRVSDIELEAVLSEFQSTLGNAFSWKRGSIINIDLPLDPQVKVKSGGAPLFIAGMGRKDGRIALRLLRRVEAAQTESEKNINTIDKKFEKANASEKTQNMTTVEDRQQKEEQNNTPISQGVSQGISQGVSQGISQGISQGVSQGVPLDPSENLLEPQIDNPEETDQAGK